ncbi:hypothetical protein GCM10025794_38040 [Massilia kyonggiensis]
MSQKYVLTSLSPLNYEKERVTPVVFCGTSVVNFLIVWHTQELREDPAQSNLHVIQLTGTYE